MPCPCLAPGRNRVLGDLYEGPVPDALFRERQRFTQWWIWLIVLGGAGVVWWVLVAALADAEPFADAGWAAWLAWAAAGVVSPLLFGVLSLDVEVRADAFLIRFAPFVRQLILNDGRSILVGSQRAEDLAAAIGAARRLCRGADVR